MGRINVYVLPELGPVYDPVWDIGSSTYDGSKKFDTGSPERTDDIQYDNRNVPRLSIGQLDDVYAHIRICGYESNDTPSAF